MKKNLLSLFIVLFINISVKSQVHLQKNLGTGAADYLREIINTNDGKMAAIGISYQNDTLGDVLLCKLDLNGSIIWSKSYGSILSEEGYDLKQDKSGNFIIMAQATIDAVNGDLDVLLIKTDSAGNLNWSHSYGDTYAEEGYSLDITSDGNYVVAGSTDSYSNSEVYAYIFKTDTAGVLTWTRNWEIPSSLCFFIGSDSTTDGGIITCGERFLGSNDFIIAKYDVNGSTQWEKSVGTASADFGFDVIQTQDGGYVACGISSSIDIDAANTLVFKMDAAGTITWAKDIGGEFNNRANGITEASDGSLLVSGYTVVDTGSSTTNPIHNPFLMKLDATGNFLWAKRYGQDSIESRSYSLVENSAGTICLVGETFSFGANTGDAYLIGANVDGFTGCYESNFAMTSTDVVLTATSIGTDSIGSLAYSYTLTGQPISLNENTVCLDNAVVDLYQSPSLIIYPNPADNLLTIDLSGFGLSEPVISIYNSFGEIVKSFSGNDAVNLITVENLPKGVYYMNVKTDRNQLTKSFLKK